MLKPLKYFLILCLITISTYQPVKAEIIVKDTANKNATLYTHITEITENKLSIDLRVDPGNQSINLIGTYIKYSSSTLSLIDINLDESFCKFTAENTHYADKGGQLLICGAPSPGTSTDAIIASLNFDIIKTDTPLKIKPLEESMVLANDGLGSNILAETIGTQIIFP